MRAARRGGVLAVRSGCSRGCLGRSWSSCGCPSGGGGGGGVHCARPAAFSELEGSPFALRSPSRNAGCFGATPHLIAPTFYHLPPTAARSPTPPTAPQDRPRSSPRQSWQSPCLRVLAVNGTPAASENAKGCARDRRDHVLAARYHFAPSKAATRAGSAQTPSKWTKWRATRPRARRSSPTS